MSETVQAGSGRRHLKQCAAGGLVTCTDGEWSDLAAVSRALCEIDGRNWDDLYDESKASYRGLAPRLVAAVLGLGDV